MLQCLVDICLQLGCYNIQAMLLISRDHVFLTSSPKLLHLLMLIRNHCGQAFRAPSNASFNSTHSGRSWPMHPGHPECHYDPIFLESYIAQLENLLLGGPDPDNSADLEIPKVMGGGHGSSRR